MNADSTHNKGAVEGSAEHLDHVTPAIIHLRTCRLAGLRGRLAGQVTQVDYEQAKQELYRESILNRQMLSRGLREP
jgi:hypothetical protein